MATTITLQAPSAVEQGQDVGVTVTLDDQLAVNQAILWTWEGTDYVLSVQREIPISLKEATVEWSSAGMEPGTYKVTAQLVNVTPKGPSAVGGAGDHASFDIIVTPSHQILPDSLPVSLRRTDIPFTADETLWSGIRAATERISFNQFKPWMDAIACNENPKDNEPTKSDVEAIRKDRSLPFPDIDAYRTLKAATEVFLMARCGVWDFGSRPDALGDDGRFSRAFSALELETLYNAFYLTPIEGPPDDVDTKAIPYLAMVRLNLGDVPILPDGPDPAKVSACFGILRQKLTSPCFLELIWSYWHEEGMLVQTMNAITRRFQNIRAPGDRDPLAHVEIDPLRPLNNLLWGYIQDEEHHLSVMRRAYEYDHHYGISLHGRAVGQIRAADTRSKFIEAFHNLLYTANVFHQHDDDTTMIADGFPVLNALKEVHLILSQGAHNQFGDLPWVARQEMLMEEWLLSRPEFRDFLPTRIMVAYPEPWMHRVDAMKTLQAWGDTSVMHFRDLGVFGEQLLLSIRYGNWNNVFDRNQATNWARYWRQEIANYMHAYWAVTGVDLRADVSEIQQRGDRFSQPSLLLRRRLASAHRVQTPARSASASQLAQPSRPPSRVTP
jgi:hypothetical protein